MLNVFAECFLCRLYIYRLVGFGYKMLVLLFTASLAFSLSFSKAARIRVSFLLLQILCGVFITRKKKLKGPDQKIRNEMGMKSI